MLEILQFIFSSFWVWLGSMSMLLLVALVLESVASIFARAILAAAVLRKDKKKDV